MRKEMGNQNTSGILAEEKNANGAAEKVPDISSSEDLKEENKILNQENGAKDVQEKAEEAEADESCPVEELTSGEKEVVNGSVNEDYGIRTTSFDDASSNLKESNLAEGTSKFDDDVHDQPCTLNEEKQISEFNFEAKSTSISSLPQEAVDITSEPQSDCMLTKENDEKVREDPPQDEQNNVSEPKSEKQISEFNFEAKLTSISSLPQEAVDITSEPQSDCTLTKENDEKVRDDPPQDERNNVSESKSEKQDGFLHLDEEKLTMNEIVNKDNTSNDREEVLLDDEATENHETDGIGSIESLESNSSKDSNEVMEVLNEVGLGQSILTVQNQEEEKPMMESSESETSIVEECATRSQSLLEIEKVNEFETRLILEERESKGNESEEKLGVESNLRYKGHQVELRKSPSFDFGIPFDPKSQESDQTPLLYQDRPPMRSFSSCSGLRFQNRSVQTEYLGKSLHYETVEVEEKTIRMERSHSESLKTVAKEKQENLDEDCDVISPKGNGKRKPKSSLFTTCICCTAAIS